MGLDMKVLYCSLKKGSPVDLSARICPMASNSSLVINGSEIRPPECATIPFRLDQTDSGSQILTYIATDHIRASGSFRLEIRCQKKILMDVAILRRSAPKGWSLECQEGLSGSSGVEVCIVGNFDGACLILTSPAEKKSVLSTEEGLDVIVEDDEEEDEHPPRFCWTPNGQLFRSFSTRSTTTTTNTTISTKTSSKKSHLFSSPSMSKRSSLHPLRLPFRSRRLSI